jgi:hypothetical protein
MMRRTDSAVLFAALLVASVAVADDGPILVPPWGPKLEEVFQKYQTCDLAGNETSPTACNIFLARALEAVYGVTDFKDPKRPAGYLDANSIADQVAISEEWERIGTASEPSALKQATQDANRSVAVVAVWKNPDPNGHGHGALVLPGPASSTSWGSDVPNSASFFLSKPVSESYIGLPLSKAFKKSIRNEIILYRHVHRSEGLGTRALPGSRRTAQPRLKCSVFSGPLLG